MENLNKVELRGRVGRAWKRENVGGIQHLTFMMATTYGYTDTEGNAVMETTWHEVRAWGSGNIKPETLDKIGIGSEVRVVGRLKSVRYTKSDGSERTTYVIVASEVELIEE